MSGTLSLTFNVSSAPTNVVLPIVENPSDPITFTIDWGDSTTDSLLTHTYATNASFTAVITITAGSVTTFGSSGWAGVARLTAVATTDNTTWGLPGVESFVSAFEGAVLLTSVPTDVPSSVRNMTNMFRTASTFNQDISGWDVSLVTNMGGMFNSAALFNQDISSWNVSSVTNMSSMFANNTGFNNGAIGNVGGKPLTWTTGTGTSLVQTMLEMFESASAFNQDISSWNVSNVTDMSTMFKQATLFNNGAVGNVGGKPLTWTTGTGTINVTNMTDMFNAAFAFNQAISTWNVSKVNTMYRMFSRCNLFNQDISNWDVSLVTSMFGMFFNAYGFNQDISGWNVSSVTNMSEMFMGATIFDQNIRYWVVVDPTNVDDMFASATAMAVTYTGITGYGTTPSYTFFNQEPPAPPPTLSLTFNVTSQPTSVTLPITGTDVLVSIDWGDGTIDTSLSHTYTTNASRMAEVTITDGSVSTFGSSGWTGVAILTDVSTNSLTDWGLPDVTSFANAFNGATLLVSVPTYLPSSVTNLSYMFNNADAFNQNISGWNVSLVTNMRAMFAETLLFNQNIGGWNVSSVLDMSLMFDQSNFNQNIGEWNVSSVLDMNNMFANTSAFDQDITSWNVSSVTDMGAMFQNAVLFDQNIRVWSVVSPTTLTNMFSGATAMTATYGSVAGYGDTPTYAFFTGPPTPYPCFLEDTQILCLENGREVYRPVQSLRKGDLVKTIYNGFLPIHMIGKTSMYNPNNNDRIASRLYKCAKENYPGLFEDLYITGCHSILVPWLTYEQGQKTIASLGNLYVTDKHCRLMAWVDEKSEPYKMAGVYNIYHIALENNDYYMNYGIYANGLLVESCSKRYLAEISNMRILGEEDCCLTEGVSAEENVFHKMPCLIETC